jgi:peptide/nickel transport system permease protein
MLRYLGGRALEMIPVALLMSVAAFMILQLVPGDPVQLNLGLKATPAQVAEKRAELGLDQPVPAQYADFVTGALTFDFGRSIDSGEPVSSILGRRVVPSLLLIGYALVVALVIAVPLGVLAAVRRRTWIDQAIRLMMTVTYVMPTFWLALLLVWVVSVQLGWLPSSDYGDTFVEHIRSLTLPAITIGLTQSPTLLRLLRSSMIETLQSEYIEAARARGLAEPRVIGKHALRPSSGSPLTLLGFILAVLLSSTVVVETIFSIPGLGSLAVQSVSERDFPVVQALTLLFGIAVLVVSLIFDLIYALVDPRVRL